MPASNVDPVAARATEVHSLLNKIVTSPSNGASSLNSELRALVQVIVRLPKWLARTGAQHDAHGAVTLTLAHLDAALKSIAEIPPHGPEHNSKSDAVRPKLTSALAQLLSFGVAAMEKDSGEIAKLEAAINTALATQKKEYDAVLADARAAVEMAKKAAETATESAKKVGVTVQMTAFTLAKDSHRKWAIGWAVATGIVALALLGCAVYVINWGEGPPDPAGAWYVAGNLSHYLARLLGISLISYLLVFCTKNFRSSKHNEIVNGHRAGALATFDTLRTPGDKTLDHAIMLHVADAVFTSRPSGYDGDETSGTHATELLAPVIKKLTGGD